MSCKPDNMPRDLPGLYWDEEKKRYFPESSRPARATSKPAHSSEAAPSQPQQSRRRRRSPQRTGSESPPPKRQHAVDDAQSVSAWRSFSALRESSLSVHRRRCVQYVVSLDSCSRSGIDGGVMTISELEMGYIADSVAKVENIPISFDGPITSLCTKVCLND